MTKTLFFITAILHISIILLFSFLAPFSVFRSFAIFYGSRPEQHQINQTTQIAVFDYFLTISSLLLVIYSAAFFKTWSIDLLGSLKDCPQELCFMIRWYVYSLKGIEIKRLIVDRIHESESAKWGNYRPLHYYSFSPFNILQNHVRRLFCNCIYSGL